MDLAWISVIALGLTILVSCTTRLNPGVLAVVFAWIIAACVAPALGQTITLKTVLSGFPVELFLTLVGVTLLFSQAQTNGTLDLVARAAVGFCQGRAGLIPLVFFLLTAAVSFVGAGSVAAAALIAPAAMASAARAGIPAFLMAVMVGHGAIAGGMSPFAMTGIIANGLMARMELGNLEWQTFFYNFFANALVAPSGYFLLGGRRLFGRETQSGKRKSEFVETSPSERSLTKLPSREGLGVGSGVQNAKTFSEHPPPIRSSRGEGEDVRLIRFSNQHLVTLVAIAVLIVAVLIFKAHVGLAAFAAAAGLIVTRVADEKAAFQAMPWPVILMVCGVTLLTSLLERTGGMERITDVIALAATKGTAPAIVSFATGVVSVYSSTSGVVLPAFLPMVPRLVEKLGGGDALAIASSINIGGNLVDVSPLSTIGALCIACAAASEDRRVLFNKVLAWGLSMSLVGAVLCALLFALR